MTLNIPALKAFPNSIAFGLTTNYNTLICPRTRGRINRDLSGYDLCDKLRDILGEEWDKWAWTSIASRQVEVEIRRGEGEGKGEKHRGWARGNCGKSRQKQGDIGQDNYAILEKWQKGDGKMGRWPLSCDSWPTAWLWPTSRWSARIRATAAMRSRGTSTSEIANLGRITSKISVVAKRRIIERERMDENKRLGN